MNLERPLAANGRLSGHVVQGHVDGTGELVSFEMIGDGNWWLKVRVPEELDRFLVYKGSVAVDGISLTVATIENQVMGITIIPHTVEMTCLGGYKIGDRVNIESDIWRSMSRSDVSPDTSRLSIGFPRMRGVPGALLNLV